MRVALILAVLLPLAAVVAWYVSRPIIAARLRRRHLAELEAEDKRWNKLIHPTKGGVRGDD